MLSFVHEQLSSHDGDLESARQLLKTKCKEDLWFLCYNVLDMRDIYTELHMDMCTRWVARRKAPYTLWMTPRFHLKTSLWTRGGTIQDLLINPQQRALVVNAKLENAVDILADIKLDWETNELLRWLFPEYVVDFASKQLRAACKWGTTRLDFPCSQFAGRKEGNIQIMGVEASLVSKHYDLMIYDDPVNDVNTATKAYRDKIERWYQNSLNLRVDSTSRIRLIGTRWHFDDLYSRIIKKEISRRAAQKAAKKKINPRYMIYHRSALEKVEYGGEKVAGFDDVLPIWPERFSSQDIEDMRDDMGSYVFACQLMNNPVPEEDAIFKFSDIKPIDYYDIPQDVVNFACIDMAVEETEQGDFTVITVASFDQVGRMYVRKIIRDKLLPSNLLEHLNAVVKAYDIKRVGIEVTAFQKTLYRIYKEWAAQRGYYVPWVPVERGKTSKRKRIMALQPRVERGDFMFEKDINCADWMIEEMTTYPRSAHDDILDTLADLDTLFYKAPQEMIDAAPKNTYDSYYGPLSEDDDEFDEEPGSILNVAEMAEETTW